MYDMRYREIEQDLLNGSVVKSFEFAFVVGLHGKLLLETERQL